MDNTNTNQTTMEQMPSGMNMGMGGSVPPQKEKHTGRTLFISLLVIVIAGFLAYWFMSKSTEKSGNQNQTQTTNTQDDQTAAVNAALEAENDLNNLYFEGVSSGL